MSGYKTDTLSSRGELLSVPLEKFEFDRVHNFPFSTDGTTVFRRRDRQTGDDVIELMIYTNRLQEVCETVCLKILNADTSEELDVLGVGNPAPTHQYSSTILWHCHIPSAVSVKLVLQEIE